MVTAKIKNILTPGSYGALVEYKLSTDTEWTTPNIPANPTLNTEYPILIAENTYYDARITNIDQAGRMCRSVTIQLFNSPGDTCCPPTYTLADDTTYCYKYDDVAATPPSSAENTIPKNSIAYSPFGTLIYDEGFNVSGYGPYTLIPHANPFWVNGSGGGAGANTTLGPLNRAGLWSVTEASGQTIGFTICNTLSEPKLYYIGCAGDNEIKISLDSDIIVDMDPAAMVTYFDANGYPGIGSDLTFKFWHIYPVYISAGPHFIEIIGTNISSIAAMGAEIYDATPSELQSTTSYGDLGSKLIFSTKDYIGDPVQLGSGGIGYTCPPDYALNLCDGPPFCRKILTTATISC